MTANTRAELAAVPGIAPIRDAATAGFVFNHTMLRVKDPQASLDFYTRVLGFSLVRRNDFPEAGFSLYFLAIVDPARVPADEAARRAWVAGLQGVLGPTPNPRPEAHEGHRLHPGPGRLLGRDHPAGAAGGLSAQVAADHGRDSRIAVITTPTWE